LRHRGPRHVRLLHRGHGSTARNRPRKIRAVPTPPVGEMTGKVRETLGHLPLQPEDAGIAALAERIARTVDDAAELAEAAANIAYDPDTSAQTAARTSRTTA
jgi:hypothetical protein